MERREGRGGNDILSKGGHETERKVKRTLRHINGLALAAPGGCGQAKGGAGHGRRATTLCGGSKVGVT